MCPAGTAPPAWRSAPRHVLLSTSVAVLSRGEGRALHSQRRRCKDGGGQRDCFSDSTCRRGTNARVHREELRVTRRRPHRPDVRQAVLGRTTALLLATRAGDEAAVASPAVDDDAGL